MTPHILFAAYQTDRGSNGGMESATHIFEALADDFRWTLLTNRETPRNARWRAGGARVLNFAFDEGAGRIARSAQLSLAATRALALSANILHGNDIRGVQILLYAARLRRVPLALTLRDTKPESDRYSASWHRIAQRLDALITLSDDMAQRVGDRLPVPAARRHTINSIVDLDAFHPPDPNHRAASRACLGIGAEECAVGMVAGVFDKKRQLEVIRDVLPQLADLHVRLHLVGDFKPHTESYAQVCADMVAALGLEDRVVFHGFRSDVADWMAALDIVLVASRREGLARCMIEAMACGTPVVSVDVCSAREMLESTGAGIVVGMDDWAGLAAALRDLSTDSKKRAAMGQRGREAALARFSTQRVAQSWHDLYDRLGGTRME
ncbi:putative transferase [Roseobacter sp. AzwK-3b]|uniref:glycosyltransferase family 4 protein n=1 Tax=Roseobacter sp. AzwK-3b TaxID=351016 RepID=UPI000156A975|nr:glycosyltransferase family 4 protein [Roseobacter sp. AzwK-3b]EDM69918.1 putative transferase [Roseobacter sp. AzwK-3b]